MFKLPCFFSVLFPLFLITSSSSNNNTSSSNITTCTTKRCPNGPNISYPFWLSHGSIPDQYCGYQEFGLICLDDGTTIFSPPPGLYYYVKEIDYDNHSVKLIDFDTANTTCPRALHSFPLANQPLSHSPLNLNLSFYYNCSSYPSSNVSDISCLRNGAEESFVFLAGNETKGFDWSERCEQNVVVTVLKDQITRSDGGGLVDEFAGAMNEGFVLEWQTSANCKKCEDSGGNCGFSNTRKEFLCFCKDGSVRSNNCGGGTKTELSKLIIGLIAGAIGVLLIICIILCIFRQKLSSIAPVSWKTRKCDQDIEAYIRNNGPLAIKRYTYSDIKKMTNSFEFKLGEGGYGQVYKGILNNGSHVAVKLLNASKGNNNGEEFINEVLSISKTSHVNIVTLLGFCIEGRKKALICEFMPNGSLEKFIYSNNIENETNPTLSWERLLKIAEGIAKGLEYLHRGCNTRILHLDIKPNNILLDKNFCPKISDFGLAKFCSTTHSIVSMLDARGTIGYIAPEVWNRNFGGVSNKSDVFSYGMMILEMVGGKHNTNAEVTNSSELYFPNWIYKHIEGKNNNSVGFWKGATLSREENEIVKKMIMIGLWCIQTLPSERPSMSRVIEMLEGSIEQLRIPPKPFIFEPTSAKVESCATCSNDQFSTSYDE